MLKNYIYSVIIKFSVDVNSRDSTSLILSVDFKMIILSRDAFRTRRCCHPRNRKNGLVSRLYLRQLSVKSLLLYLDTP